MKQLDLSAHVVNRDYSVWPIEFAFCASFEIPIQRLAAALPPQVFAIEVRPGIGLLNFSVFHFPADTFGLSAPCTELVCSAHVLPNLAWAPTLPRLSMHTFGLAATTQEFIDSPFATDQYPVHPEPIDIRIDREQIAVEVRDRHGAPMLTLARPAGFDARYAHDRFYVQSSACKAGTLFVAGNLFEFRRVESQRKHALAGAPVSHAAFGGVDVGGLTARHCHLQMWSEPGSRGVENHFFLRPVAAGRSSTGMAGPHQLGPRRSDVVGDG